MTSKGVREESLGELVAVTVRRSSDGESLENEVGRRIFALIDRRVHRSAGDGCRYLLSSSVSVSLWAILGNASGGGVHWLQQLLEGPRLLRFPHDDSTALRIRGVADGFGDPGCLYEA